MIAWCPCIRSNWPRLCSMHCPTIHTPYCSVSRRKLVTERGSLPNKSKWCHLPIYFAVVADPTFPYRILANADMYGFVAQSLGLAWKELPPNSHVWVTVLWSYTSLGRSPLFEAGILVIGEISVFKTRFTLDFGIGANKKMKWANEWNMNWKCVNQESYDVVPGALYLPWVFSVT